MNSKQKCEFIISTALSCGFVSQISQHKLRDLIASSLILVDERSINKWEKALCRFGYIQLKEARISTIYTWNYDKFREIPALQQLTIQQAQQGVDA